jgi:hypothetical protein
MAPLDALSESSTTLKEALTVAGGAARLLDFTP